MTLCTVDLLILDCEWFFNQRRLANRAEEAPLMPVSLIVSQVLNQCTIQARALMHVSVNVRVSVCAYYTCKCMRECNYIRSNECKHAHTYIHVCRHVLHICKKECMYSLITPYTSKYWIDNKDTLTLDAPKNGWHSRWLIQDIGFRWLQLYILQFLIIVMKATSLKFSCLIT